MKSRKDLEELKKKEDYYDILGLSPNASLQEMKESYRSLAKEWHPDKRDSGDEEVYTEGFKYIDTAYKNLSEQKSREENDCFSPVAKEDSQCDIKDSQCGIIKLTNNDYFCFAIVALLVFSSILAFFSSKKK